ncbi:hypothetical protein OAM69_05750 [bacterium]|nr:hypothetical protein [bacterium]
MTKKPDITHDGLCDELAKQVMLTTRILFPALSCSRLQGVV